MRRLIYIALLALLASPARAELAEPHGAVYSLAGGRSAEESWGVIPSASSSPVVFRDSFVTNTASIPNDSGTVSHITFAGSNVISDTGATSWTRTGTPTTLATSTASYWYPSGFASNPMPAALNFATSSYWQSSTSADVFDFTGDFYCTARYEVASRPNTDSFLLENESAARAAGWFLEAGRSVASHVVFSIRSTGPAADSIQDTPDNDGPNVVSFGRASTTQFLKVNQRTVVSGAITHAIVAATGDPTFIGGTPVSAGWGANGIHLQEVMCSSATPSSALFDAIHNKVWGHIADTGQTLTVTRASTATTVLGGVRWTVPVGVARTESTGLSVEPASTNNLLNATAPVTQTTASLGTGSYTGWMEGSGSLAFTAGSATATGLPCTATTGAVNDCHFTITVAGTVTATVTGTVTAEQLEPLGYRTSLIVTAGTAASRSADVVSLARPAALDLTASWCAGAKLTPEGGRAYSTGAAAVLSAGASHAGANSMEMAVSTARSFTGAVYDATLTIKQAASTLGSDAAATLLLCDAAGTLTQSVNGTPASPTISGAGTGIFASNPTTLYLGSLSGGGTTWAGGNIQSVVLCNSANAGACQ